MKRPITLFVAIILFCSISKAQYVSIPDSSFRSFLKNKYPTCFNAADQMDTTCNSIVNEDTLSIDFGHSTYNPTQYNLQEVRYFKSLVHFSFDTYSSSILNIPEFPETIREMWLYHTNAITSLAAFPDSLKKLIIYDGFMQSAVPAFPNGIREINITSSGMTSLPSLPDSLLRFTVGGCHQLASLPALPPNLRILLIAESGLSSLPDLPVSLDSLWCSASPQITNLPSLPIHLRYINCVGNNLLSLPQLPDSLKFLDCSENNSLLSLPLLPEGLEQINCKSSSLSGLPELPGSLTTLNCSGNKIQSLPLLPSNLGMLYCSDNLLQVLPTIPNTLLQINFSGNQIRSIPQLPNTLQSLWCGNNPLRNLPDHLPDSLMEFFCYSDSLTSLPALPARLISMNCSNNLLTSLPPLPNLGHLNCQNNNIYCLPKLPPGGWTDTQYFIDMDKITCIPNYGAYIKFMIPNTSPYLSDLWMAAPPIPLCNPTNNVNNCHGFPLMNGTVFYDNNSNGIKDAGEPVKSNAKVFLSSHNYSFSNNSGYYEISGDSAITYNLSINPPAYFNAIPATVTYNFTSYDTIVTKNFALQANVTIDSLAIKIDAVNPAARPGFSFPYLISYQNAGTTTLSPNIIFNFDNTKLTYDSSSNIVVVNNGSSLLLPVGSLVSGQQENFIAYFTVKTSTALGDSLLAKAVISANGSDDADSVTTFIRGAFDPNDKQATPQLSRLQLASGQYIDYSIRFQNTGTDTAFNVVISDTLSNDLLANDLQVISASHTCKTTVKDNIIYFEFLDILLPDSNVNEPKSHGFISFRIKANPVIPENTTIPNKAAIYFDYNVPVITNTVGTLIKGSVVLPLRLISFSAVPQTDNSTILFWNTINEINIKHFVIEHSTDNLHFNPLATVTAKREVNNNYNESVDEFNAGIIYYRLKIIDNDGSFSYSPIIKIEKRKNVAGLSVLTNPVKDFIIINTTDRSLNNTQCNIINTQGVVVKSFIIINGSQTVEIKTLPRGIYYLRTINSSSSKIFIQ